VTRPSRCSTAAADRRRGDAKLRMEALLSGAKSALSFFCHTASLVSRLNTTNADLRPGSA
jgi:hypothetical protein